MSEYYSTQSTIEARISSTRLNDYLDGDNDTLADENSLESAFKAARSIIRDRLVNRFGSTVIAAWDSDTVPDTIQRISDDLSIYQIFITNPVFLESMQILRQNALDELDLIAGGAIALYGVTPETDDLMDTGRIKSDFDPERTLNNQSVRTTWITPDLRELEDYPE